MRAIGEIPVRVGQEGVAPAVEEGAVLPIPARRVTLDQLNTSHHPLVATAVNAARAWAVRKAGGQDRISLVLVAGPVMVNGRPDISRTGYGCGKTHIARAVQWSSYVHLEDGTPVAPAGRFYVAQDLLELLGAGNTMGELVPAATETDYGRFGGTPVVVVDDVGAEGTLEYVAAGRQGAERWARYFEAVNYCYDRHISVVVTANLTLNELAAHVGGRAWSRLLEMAPAGFMVDMTGVPDWRRKASGR